MDYKDYKDEMTDYEHEHVGYEPGGVFLPPPPGEFSALFFSETPMSPEHFLLVLQSGDWGVCEL